MDKDAFPCARSTLEIYHCKYCAFKTNTRVFFWEHFQLFHAKNNKTPFKSSCPSNLCKNCNFSTFSLLLLLKHYLVCRKNVKEQVIIKYECSFCPYKGRSIYYMEQHTIKKHTLPEESNWHDCNLCDFKGKNQISLVKHIMLHHIRQSEEKLLLNYCDKCDFKSVHKKSLENHIIQKHTAPEDIQWHQCEHCTFRSKSKSGLTRHVKIQHILKEEKKHPRQKNVPKYECNTCDYNTISKLSFKRHIMHLHTAPGDIQWHQCEYCEYKSLRKNWLSLHIVRKHPGVINVVTKSYSLRHPRLRRGN